jgi:RNA polymerase sigma factor (sigma-70 family)
MPDPTTDPLHAAIERAKAGDRRSLEAVVGAVTDDVYRIAFRMLGLRADAEDATQEVLIQVLTHLSQFRGDSRFKTWVYRIAVRHIARAAKTKREEIASFDNIERLIAAGDANPPMLALGEAELHVLEEEVRLSCTQAMVLSLDRELRLSYIMAEVFELESEEAAVVLGIDAAAHRKRLQRARERLGAWMSKRCGLVDPSNLCRCRRQIPVANGFGVAVLESLQYAGHPAGAGAGATVSAKKPLPIAEEAAHIEAAAEALRHPEYAAPASVLEKIRGIIDSGRFRMFDA